MTFATKRSLNHCLCVLTNRSGHQVKSEAVTRSNNIRINSSHVYSKSSTILSSTPTMTHVQYNPVQLARYINLRFVGEQEQANQQGGRDKGQPEDINEDEIGVSEHSDFMTDAMDLQLEEDEMVTEEPALAPSPSPPAALPPVSSPDPVAAPPQQGSSAPMLFTGAATSSEQPEDEDIDDVGLSEEELMADVIAVQMIENEMETQEIEIPTSMPSSNNLDSNSPSIVLLF